MTEKQFLNSTLAMINNSISSASFKDQIEKAMMSGCIDVKNTQESDYITRKALIHVIFTNLADSWRPLSIEGRKEADNISKFV